MPRLCEEIYQFSSPPSFPPPRLSLPLFDVFECTTADNEVISPREQQRLVSHQISLEVLEDPLLLFLLLLLQKKNRKTFINDLLRKNCEAALT